MESEKELVQHRGNVLMCSVVWRSLSIFVINKIPQEPARRGKVE